MTEKHATSVTRSNRSSLQYTCKRCSYINCTQEAIAVHFLQEHMGMDFCSLSDPVAQGDERSTKRSVSHSPGSDEEASQDVSSDVAGRSIHQGDVSDSTEFQATNLTKPTDNITLSTSHVEASVVSRKKVGSRKRKCRSVKLIGSTASETTDSELGRGKRRKSTPRRFILDDDQANLKPNGAAIKKHAESESMVSLTGKTPIRNSITETENIQAQCMNIKSDGSANVESRLTRSRLDGKLSTSDQASTTHFISNRPTKKMHSALQEKKVRKSRSLKSVVKRKSKKMRSRKACAQGEPWNEKMKQLPIPVSSFSKKLEQMITDWNSKQQDGKENSSRMCSFEDCGIKLMEDEIEVHESCHAKCMDGLRCPHCVFLCLHWRHMRKHLGKRHEIWKGRMYHCDQENCEHKCSRFNQLRKHVKDRHFKETLMERILKGDFDPTEFEMEDVRDMGKVPKKRQREQDDTIQEKANNIPKKKRKKNQSGSESVVSENSLRNKVTFVCDLCSSKFKDEKEMEEHKQSHLTSEVGILLCPECGQLFDGSELLKDHYREQHARKLLRHQCPECPFASDKFYQLNAHLAVHTGRKGVVCGQCGKRLANQYNLRVHEFRKHSSEDQMTVTCPACTYRCADKSILRDHIKQHHKHLLKNPVYHRCPHCDYVGHKKQSLEFHMRIHTEQRRFKCLLCPYASKTRNHLKIHMQTHDGYQTAVCPHCDFKAASKKRLSEHIMRRHIQVEPYLCTICGWRTAYSGNMWKHVNQHRKQLGTAMPDEPVTVEMELLKGAELPVVPKAPTGRSRGQAGLGIACEIEDQVGLYNVRQQGQSSVRHDVSSAGTNQMQVLEISSSDGTQTTYVEGDEGKHDIQIVQIEDDSLGLNAGLGEQVLAHIHHGGPETDTDQPSRMEIFITHDAVGTAEGPGRDKAVEVLHVREDGSIVTSTMNRDVEVAVLALAQLEPGTHSTDVPDVVGEGGRITILQTASHTNESSLAHDAVTSAAMEAGIHIETPPEPSEPCPTLPKPCVDAASVVPAESTAPLSDRPSAS